MAYVLEVETSFPVAAAVGSENLSKNWLFDSTISVFFGTKTVGKRDE